MADERGGPSMDRDRAGFTLVEVVVAVVVLAVGLLGLAATTGWVVRQTTLSEVTTDRSFALQTVVEELRATPFDDVDSGSREIGSFTVTWTVERDGDEMEVEVETSGPGLRSGGGLPTLGPNVADTFTFRRVDTQ